MLTPTFIIASCSICMAVGFSGFTKHHRRKIFKMPSYELVFILLDDNGITSIRDIYCDIFSGKMIMMS
jgi:hypothetical protein